MNEIESIEVCEREIEESISILKRTTDGMVDTSYRKAKIINATGIIKLFTDVLIEYAKKGDKNEQKSNIETTS